MNESSGLTKPNAEPPNAYGRVAQAFHWVSVTLLAALVPLGLLVIVLTVLRLGWKVTQPKVNEAQGLARWESVLSRVTHWALYAILLAMPLSGLLMSQGAGRPTSFFHLFDLPQMLWVDPALKPREQANYLLGKWLHESVVQWALYLVVALHVAGAIKHRYVDGDRTFLRRMWR